MKNTLIKHADQTCRGCHHNDNGHCQQPDAVAKRSKETRSVHDADSCSAWETKSE